MKLIGDCFSVIGQGVNFHFPWLNIFLFNKVSTFLKQVCCNWIKPTWIIKTESTKKPEISPTKKNARWPLNFDYRLQILHLPPDLYAATKGCKIKAS